MTNLELANLIRFKTRTNATTFTDTDMLPLVKLRQDELARKLMNSLNSDEDIFLSPTVANLVDSSTTREYPLPSDLLSKIKRIEAKLDGTNWIRLIAMDINDYKYTHDETTIVNYFTNEQDGAKYDIRRKAIYIYSGTLTAVTGGLKLWCFDYPASITDLTENTLQIEDDPDTTHHGFPRELHELLARGVIIDYKESREKPIPLSQFEKNYDMDVAAAIQTLKNGDQGKEVIAFLPPSSERGNDGQDY